MHTISWWSPTSHWRMSSIIGTLPGTSPSGQWSWSPHCWCFTGCPPRGIPKVVSLGEETPRSGTRRCNEHKT
jgi:hypothetical protein